MADLEGGLTVKWLPQIEESCCLVKEIWIMPG
jgi:hypothetical protein